MRTIAFLLSVGAIPALFGGKPAVSAHLSNQPAYFEETSRTGRYFSRGAGYSIETSAAQTSIGAPGFSAVMRLVGANARAVGRLESELPGRSNYMLGDRSRWRTGVRHYARASYASVYPGIDIAYYGTGKQLEYDFVVAPNADPGAIRLTFEGTDRVSIDGKGDLLLERDGRQMRQHKPVVYQECSGVRIPVNGEYRLRGRTVSFRVGEYDRSKPLVIDPVLSYATYLGGGRMDVATGLAVDAAGNTYVVGATDSSNFPLGATPYSRTLNGVNDVTVTKYGPNGALVYSTYIGGNGEELAGGIAVDAGGNVWIAGYTDSVTFPLVNPLQAVNRGGVLGWDAFVSKLSASGSELLFSTYHGGNIDDIALAVAVDSAGNAYVSGATASANFPVSGGAYQTINRGLLNGFITKFSATGSSVMFSTLLGGFDVDSVQGVAIDPAGMVYVTGTTSSSNFPTTTGASQTALRGGDDAFIAKLNPTGTALLYSSLLGGAGNEFGFAIALDVSSNAYITGRTGSADFPTTAGVVQAALSGPEDAFVARFDSTGARVFSTLFGGSRLDYATDIAVDRTANVYIFGQTNSANLPVASPSQAQLNGTSDAFVSMLNPAATAVLQSTYFGGGADESSRDIALDSAGSVYIAGDTTSGNLPVTTGAPQAVYGGLTDIFVAKLNFASVPANLTVAPNTFRFEGAVGATIRSQALTISAPAGTTTGWSVELTARTGGNWLSASPRLGSGPGTVEVIVNTAGMQAGTFDGTITFVNQAANTRTAIPVALVVSAAGGQVPQNGIVNAASFQTVSAVPGLIVTVFGTNIGPAQLTGLRLTPQGTVDTLLAETRLLFDNVPAPLIYVSANQLSAIVPYEVAQRTTTSMQVEYRGVRSNAITVPVAQSAPAIFSADSRGSGPGAIQNEDGSVNSAANPAEKGSILVIYATGEGETNPPSITGGFTGSTLRGPRLPVSIRIGGLNAEILYAGAAPGAVAGLFQVNARVPLDVVSGSAVPVELTVGAVTSTSNITVAVR